MAIRVLTWNLFHGRDFPPDRSLLTWRSRLLRRSERNATHIQVNRDLLAEFAQVLGAAKWDVALLQECPPRWLDGLAETTRADAHGVLTSRNRFGGLRAALARLNPDLIASNEGGSNATLVRGRILERREFELRAGPRPERRMMAFTRAHPLGAETEICVANLHASTGRRNRALAEHEVLAAASRAREWAAGTPLVFGGDLNLRPAETDVFDTLAETHGLVRETGPAAIDHLLVRGLAIHEPPRPWPPWRRELECEGLALRLSDHAPVAAVFEAEPAGEAK